MIRSRGNGGMREGVLVLGELGGAGDVGPGHKGNDDLVVELSVGHIATVGIDED